MRFLWSIAPQISLRTEKMVFGTLIIKRVQVAEAL